MGRLVRDDRKEKVSQITTYNQGMQNTISECTAHRTLKQMSYGSRRPHRVPLLSAKNRKRRLQFAQPHQNWTTEDWKNIAWSDKSRFLLRHSDGRVRIWRKEHESMDPSCLVSTVQAAGGGVMVWGIFSWHTLGPLVPIGQAHIVEEGLETEAPTGARVGQAEQEARVGQAGQEWTLWAPGTERNLWAPGTERTRERTPP